MNIEAFLLQGLNLAGNFNPKIAIFLFLICLIGEIKLPIPYLLETTWLLAGYQFGRGILSVPHLILLWLTAQAGRQLGAMVLCHLGRFISKPLGKFRKNYFRRISWMNNNSSKVFRRINALSPFSIAFGRLIGLRIPLTVTAGIKRKFKILSLGILISSIVFDGIYITLGRVVGSTVTLKPINIFLLSLLSLTVIYAIIFGIRHIILHLLKKRKL